MVNCILQSSPKDQVWKVIAVMVNTYFRQSQKIISVLIEYILQSSINHHQGYLPWLVDVPLDFEYPLNVNFLLQSSSFAYCSQDQFLSSVKLNSRVQSITIGNFRYSVIKVVEQVWSSMFILTNKENYFVPNRVTRNFF